MKANLNKSLDRLKHKVADREELWLEMFQDIVGVLLQREDDKANLIDRVKTGSMLADVALDEYETRWGKG